ncbi:MAG TPA: hypothetical protein VJB87_02290 [Candidatus Nanoarchaeia archaeon]|nr:hypothetical protein [Candidatus Nanoarchaeia archaeon]
MKGQTEIIGLVIIILLLIFGGIIYLKLSDTDNNQNEELRTNTRNNNILTAISQLTIQGEPFKEQLTHCKEEEQCQALHQELPKIMNIVIPKNKAYQLTIISEEQQLIKLGNCTYGIASSNSIINHGTAYTLNLKTCP